jgi:hypothetical protein
VLIIRFHSNWLKAGRPNRNRCSAYTIRLYRCIKTTIYVVMTIHPVRCASIVIVQPTRPAGLLFIQVEVYMIHSNGISQCHGESRDLWPFVSTSFSDPQCLPNHRAACYLTVLAHPHWPNQLEHYKFFLHFGISSLRLADSPCQRPKFRQARFGPPLRIGNLRHPIPGIGQHERTM